MDSSTDFHVLNLRVYVPADHQKMDNPLGRRTADKSSSFDYWANDCYAFEDGFN